MPFYRRKFRRYGKSKSKFRRSKWGKKFRGVRKYKSGIGDVTKTKLRLITVTGGTATAGGLVSSFFLLRDPSGANDWSNYTSLYDFYRVCAIKVKWIPSDPSYTAAPAYHPMYLITDQDDIDNTNLTSTAIYVQYDNVQIKDMHRPWSFYRKVPKVSTAANISGGGTTSNILTNGFCDINTRPQNGVFSFRAESLTALKEYGTFIVTYYVKFLNRR